MTLNVAGLFDIDTQCCIIAPPKLKKAKYIITGLRFVYIVWIHRSASLKPVFELVVWTAVSHGFLPARSRGIWRFLLEHRKHWCVVSHMPHMSL